MGNEHLTDEALLCAAYGVAGEDAERHLAACPRCAAAAAETAAAREAHRHAAGEVLDNLSGAFWLRQRRSVLQAAGQSGRAGAFRPAFALAMLLLVALGVSLLVPRGSVRAPAQKPILQAEDEQLLRQVYQTANRIEPEALEPLRLLLPADAENILTPSARPVRDDGTFSADSGGVFSVTVVAQRPTMRRVRR